MASGGSVGTTVYRDVRTVVVVLAVVAFFFGGPSAMTLASKGGDAGGHGGAGTIIFGRHFGDTIKTDLAKDNAAQARSSAGER